MELGDCLTPSPSPAILGVALDCSHLPKRVFDSELLQDRRVTVDVEPLDLWFGVAPLSLRMPPPVLPFATPPVMHRSFKKLAWPPLATSNPRDWPLPLMVGWQEPSMVTLTFSITSPCVSTTFWQVVKVPRGCKAVSRAGCR
jgi:hypothetical protein